jgi:hypothetical protein
MEEAEGTGERKPQPLGYFGDREWPLLLREELKNDHRAGSGFD